MDELLLAATALGAIGLYLMLPRERAPLAKLGTLLGAMALAGFFLFLVRSVEQGMGATAGAMATRPPLVFYLFAAIMIAGAVGVVCQPKPVYAALYFVLVTLAGAGMLVLLLAEFMAIVLIIIYAGAILVTYVFVIMLASQGSAPSEGGGTGGQVVAANYDRRASSSFSAVVVSFVLVGAVLQVLLPMHGPIAIASDKPTPMHKMMERSVGTQLNPEISGPVAATVPAANGVEPERPSNVQLLGASLYSQYSLSLELAGILLTIALVGSVMIARKNVDVQTELLGTGKVPAE